MSNFSFNFSSKGDFTLIELSGRIMDPQQTSDLLSEYENHLSVENNMVILDIHNLEYINSNGLNCFINMLTKARNVGGELIISRVPETIQKLLLISKLNTVFTITENLEDATAQLQDK